jgi:hypothetical protein
MIKRQKMVPLGWIAHRVKKRLNGLRVLGAGKFLFGTNQNHLPLSEGGGDAQILREKSKDFVVHCSIKYLFKFGRKNCELQTVF